MLDSPGDARADVWIVRQVAWRTGLSPQYAGEDHGVAQVLEQMGRAQPAIAGISWKRLAAEYAVTYPCRAIPDAGEPVALRDRFPRSDGRGKLVPVSASAAAELPDGNPPLVLITGRELEHWPSAR